jgi:hypothetical protein
MFILHGALRRADKSVYWQTRLKKMWYVCSRCVGCRIQKNSVLSMSTFCGALAQRVSIYIFVCKTACCGQRYILGDHNLHSCTVQVIFRQEAISVMMVVHEHRKS